MGSALSSAPNNHLEKELGAEFPEGEHYIGLENRNNICYSNSVIQALYYCKEFRDRILSYKTNENINDNAILHLQSLFSEIYNYKKKVGVISTKKFMSFVRKKNELFQGDNHQDTQEFLIWILNEINELLEKSKKKDVNGKTWLQSIFEGVTTTETTCMKCKSKSKRDEPFLDISLDLDQNISLNYCLKKYSNIEELKDSEKFACDSCKGLQNAEKRELIKKLPKTLIFHLKRFKYDETYKRMNKLYWKIPFPLELRWKTSDCQENESFLYNLYAVIVHIGTGIQFGHYLSVIKNNGRWFTFDDENINIVDERAFMNIFGSKNTTSCAYMLFYQLSDEDPNIPQNSPLK